MLIKSHPVDWYFYFLHVYYLFIPKSPIPAFFLQIVAGASVFFICASVLSFCMKTHPGLRVVCESLKKNITDNDEDECTEPHPYFLIVEHICNAWFTFEIAVRLIVSNF